MYITTRKIVGLGLLVQIGTQVNFSSFRVKLAQLGSLQGLVLSNKKFTFPKCSSSNILCHDRKTTHTTRLFQLEHHSSLNKFQKLSCSMIGHSHSLAVFMTAWIHKRDIFQARKRISEIQVRRRKLFISVIRWLLQSFLSTAVFIWFVYQIKFTTLYALRKFCSLLHSEVYYEVWIWKKF